MRKPALAVTSTMLDADGGNLAAVFATLAHIREDTRDLREFVDAAFPGAELEIPPPGREATFTRTYPEFVLDGGINNMYDLEADPGETRDLFYVHPEIAAELRGKLEAWDKQLG